MTKPITIKHLGLPKEPPPLPQLTDPNLVASPRQSAPMMGEDGIIQNVMPTIIEMIRGLCLLWETKRGPYRPRYVYIPEPMAHELHLECAEKITADPKDMEVPEALGKIFVGVDELIVVYFTPREGPLYVYDDVTIYLT